MDRLLEGDAVVGAREVGILGDVVIEDRGRLVVVRRRASLERDRAVGARGLHGLEDLVDAHAELRRDLVDRGAARELVGELVGRLVHLGGELLKATRHAHRPALVTEVALDLAHDRGRGIGGELEPSAGIEAVDRLDEADRAHLDEVVERLSPVLELGCEEAHEVEMAHDELVPHLGIARLLVLAEELARALLVPDGLPLGSSPEHASGRPAGLGSRHLCAHPLDEMQGGAILRDAVIVAHG